VWSSTVVWGNALLTIDGAGALGPETVVWGNLADPFDGNQ
jgi:hypothetical protein